MPLVFGVVGRSGSGKTTLIEAMLPWLQQRSLTVSVIKHCHHTIDLGPPGKDSSRFVRAGAREVMAVSPRLCALVYDHHDQPEPGLDALLARMAPVDLVLVEGFSLLDMPRLEVYRPGHGPAPLYPHDPSLSAVANDAALPIALPCLPLNDPPQVAAFICRTLGLARDASRPG
ncbi:molybdopterin-guanine dinucleotide biosynthesis protein B [Bordetella trematum]|uniref:molybdopterin-guanine dinucleotide biosynthesis protein B n=1 Tax=Bordetella trematum TaxID=123899 RepID=UPI000D9C6062|nr:molybdopterin-guanine dinucleotide biosynthesis protein B [Bordetella trematum]SPU48564.1 molybdopterin-guanine dinucleotide biosynthesis protein MobB [Bordetella trematum]VDH05256.1 Molybdopterin-guanine dinucleotide biosynthesis protein B [Bordetella trematum]